MESTSTWSSLIKGIDVGVAEAFDQGKQVFQLGMTKLYKTKNIDADRYVVSGKTPAGELKKRVQGQEAQAANRYKLYDTSYIPTEYAAYLEVTKRTLRTRGFAEIFDEAKDLTIAGRLSQDKSLAQVFNGGFATTVAVNGYDVTWYGDTLAWFSTVHTRADGGATQSNSSTTSIALTEANAETGLLALEEVLNDDGTPLSIMGKPVMVVPPALEKEATEIIKSELKSGTANNNINYYNGVIADAMKVLYLSGATGQGGSNTAWFYIIPGQAELRYVVLQDLDIDRDRNVKSGTATYTIDAMWAFGPADWRMGWGTKGDGSAYSG